MTRLHRARRTCQCATLAVLVLTPLLHLVDVNVLAGNLLSFRIGTVTVMDPLAALQIGLIARDVTRDMVIGAGIVLLMAVALGPVFCGWLCPFGFLSELIHGMRQATPKDCPSQRCRGNAASPLVVKLALLAAGLGLAIALETPLLNQLSMGGWCSRFLQDLLLLKEILWPAPACVAAVLSAEWLLAGRVWCRYLCPQSAPILAAGLLLPHRLRIAFRRASCTCKAARRPCLEACSLGLDPRSPDRGLRPQCSVCGECVAACAGKGKALTLTLGKGDG